MSKLQKDQRARAEAVAGHNLALIRELQEARAWREWLKPRLEELIRSNETVVLSGQCASMEEYKARVALARELREHILDRIETDAARHEATLAAAQPKLNPPTTP